jgi:hypothetical protein
MKIEVCSPSKTRKTFSCYSNLDLHKLKRKYNQTSRKKIKVVAPQKIWKELIKRLNCEKESCLATKLNMKTFNFAPKSPEEWKRKPTAWLSSIEITDVLTQYEFSYPDFKYLGPSPADFYFRENGTCVWEELCKFNVKEVKKTKTKVGIVFNLDTHEGDGTHWVSIFMDLIARKMYYFDSTGEKIDHHILKFYDKVNAQEPYELIQNHPTEHQFGNTECGMYTLFFIIIMIHTNDFSLFTNKKVFSDKSMIALRKKLFN